MFFVARITRPNSDTKMPTMPATMPNQVVVLSMRSSLFSVMECRMSVAMESAWIVL